MVTGGMKLDGDFISTDVLVIGAGPGGLLAALSAKRHASSGTRVTLVDSWTIGRTGHGAFSNAWTITVMPDEDVDVVAEEIVRENDWLADQRLVREVLADSHARLCDLEAAGLVFPKDDQRRYIRRPTRGLNHARVHHPQGGGLEFCWRLRLALAEAGVELLDRVFIAGLLKGDTETVTGAVGIHTRSGRFQVISARTTIVSTNAVSFRSGFARDITGTGTLLGYRAGAILRNAEQSYLRPGTPKFYFEGITFAIQEGATFVNARGDAFMQDYEPVWGDWADVPRIARAMAIEHQNGNSPIYLDMSRVAEDKRDYFIRSKVAWMDNFFRKLGPAAKTDMFGKTPYYALNQMTKMGLRTDATCRTDVRGLLAAGLAQAGCANHFAGFHFGMCIGSGWIAGRSAIEDLDTLPAPRLNVAEVNEQQRMLYAPLAEGVETRSDLLLKRLQSLMFAYDITVWKYHHRLSAALAELDNLKLEFSDLLAPHAHELVRLKETEAMMLAAEMILKASLFREESRMSHFREDFTARNDNDWLCWVDIVRTADGPELKKTAIPLPLYKPGNVSTQEAVYSSIP